MQSYVSCKSPVDKESGSETCVRYRILHVALKRTPREADAILVLRAFRSDFPNCSIRDIKRDPEQYRWRSFPLRRERTPSVYVIQRLALVRAYGKI